MTETHPSLLQTIDLQKRLWAAKSPVAILGGSRWDPQAIARFQRFAERFDLPVAVSFRRQMLFPADHPNFAGDLGIGPNPKLLARIKESDLVILVGGRLSEMPSQSYSLFGIPNPGRPLVHVHPIRRNWDASIARRWRSTPRPPLSAPRWRRCIPRSRSPGPVRGCGA